ncbi:MAG: RNA-binding domain-containing protein [Candidatus Rokuibacteriota bacterium]
MEARKRGRGRSRRAKPVQPPEEAPRESRLLDFKASIDIESTGDWCELIKDIVTMANSGGGAIVFGVDDQGKPSDADLTALLALDSAKVVDKIASYTGVQFADFHIRPGQRNGKPVAVMEIQGVFPPMVFDRAGTYEVALPDGKKKPKVAFNVGTLYFRHGAKSEPANSHDLKQVYERQRTADRKAFFTDIRMVSNKPKGARVQIVTGSNLVEGGAGKVVSVRLSGDPRAPVVGVLDPDSTHPFRQTELLTELNKRLPERRREMTGYDAQSVRKVYGIDGKPEYTHKSKFGSRQYSQAFIDWMVKESTKNGSFFSKARAKAKAQAEAQARAQAARRRK